MIGFEPISSENLGGLAIQAAVSISVAYFNSNFYTYIEHFIVTGIYLNLSSFF